MRYVIDSNASKLTLRVFATGMLSSFGHNPVFAVRTFEGDVELDEKGAGRARLSIDATSLDLQSDIAGRDRWDIIHLTHDEILEIQSYPTIVYDAPVGRTTAKPAGGNQYEVDLGGELTLHGVTRVHPVRAMTLIHGDMLRASGEVPIHQPDYKLKSVKVPGSMLKVKDEVKLSFDIVARHQQSGG